MTIQVNLIAKIWYIKIFKEYNPKSNKKKMSIKYYQYKK